MIFTISPSFHEAVKADIAIAIHNKYFFICIYFYLSFHPFQTFNIKHSTTTKELPPHRGNASVTAGKRCRQASATRG